MKAGPVPARQEGENRGWKSKNVNDVIGRKIGFNEEN